jgi:(4S)-4-hydroxy-5-phosphonooxypentane-2,3-dione isomerase
MVIFHVHAHVKPDSVDLFREATIRNAEQSVQEPGVVRFDVSQQRGDPSRFVLTEVYRDEAAPLAHKETPHYLQWRDTVASMMAEPRTSVKFSNVFPTDANWR